ncbi:MAG TPA: outer membrane lipoprotein-sorting protein [Polyangia bacterium]|nr:outer membrane lipoprotein-sorting protein [Polyangia bacterium]
MKILRAALAACVVSAAAPALADPTGPELLKKVDEALNAFKDGVFDSKLRIREPNGQAREYAFVTYQKTPNKRLVRFTSPGDVKGMGVLVENAETMYVFLPGFQKVRRMGTHIKNQTFMGSDFSFEDMSQLALSDTYDAKLTGKDDKSWILELTQKPGLDLEFPRVKLWADLNMFQPLRIVYMDASGKNLKEQVRDGYKQDSPIHWQPMRVLITDHRRNDHQSEIDFVSTKIDSGLGDDLFSVRSLVRGQ